MGVSLSACSDDQVEIPIEIKPQAPETKSTSQKEKLNSRKKLEKFFKEHETIKPLFEDILALVRAEEATDEQDFENGRKAWTSALKKSSNFFGAAALNGWVNNEIKRLGEKFNPEKAAHDILQLTDQGIKSPFLRAQNFTTEKNLATRIRQLSDLTVPTAPVLVTQAVPPLGTISKEDPMLTRSADVYCHTTEQGPWQSWIASLDPRIRHYWWGLIDDCLGLDLKASDTFLSVGRELLQNNPALSYYAAARTIEIFKANGRRQDMAGVYDLLISAWETQGLRPEHFNEPRDEFILRQINDYLWASRYQALVMKYDQAKQLAEAALDLIDTRSNASLFVRAESRRKLSEFRAEAYHALASRIYLEQKDYLSAAAMNTIALEIPGLTKEWADRLKWYLGIYRYLMGDYNAARTQWESMITESSDASSRSRLYFWLAKSYDQLHKDKERDFYFRALSEDFPLSYYAIVAGSISEFPQADQWSNRFSKFSELQDKLSQPPGDALKAWREDKFIAPLLKRAEVLVSLQIERWNKIAVQELESLVRKKYLVSKIPDAIVYLARLQYAAGDYFRLQWLIADLETNSPEIWQSHPELLLLYYPQPFSLAFEANAELNQVPAETLYALARQESAFRTEAASNVGAQGVMQLMPSTALRICTKLAMSCEGIPASLQRPEINIRIASTYVRDLSARYRKFEPAVFAAYNAGEYAVDTWLERRRNPDPLMWVELIPFQETNNYVKMVWRNEFVYKFIRSYGSTVAQINTGYGADRG